MDSADRVDFFFTTDRPWYGGYGDASSVPRIYQSPHSYSVGSPTSSAASGSGTRSTASSASKPRRESNSTYSSSSSNATSILPPPVNPIPNLNQQILSTPYRNGSDLPCEFEYAGCKARFHSNDIGNWIHHSINHFRGKPLPSKAICTFCDEHEGKFKARSREDSDLRSNWRTRMSHVADHFQDSDDETLRLDFWVIEHMRKYGLISKEDFDVVTKRSERPRGGPTIVSRRDRMSDIGVNEERWDSTGCSYDLRRENRERRREKDARTTTRSSHTLR